MVSAMSMMQLLEEDLSITALPCVSSSTLLSLVGDVDDGDVGGEPREGSLREVARTQIVILAASSSLRISLIW